MSEETVDDYHWIHTINAQAVRIELGAIYARNFKRYTRVRISARVGDLRVFGSCGAIRPKNVVIGTLTEAQIVADPNPDRPEGQRVGSLLTPHFVVANGAIEDTGDIDAAIGERDYLVFFNPVAGTALEVQVSVRVKS